MPLLYGQNDFRQSPVVKIDSGWNEPCLFSSVGACAAVRRKPRNV